MIRVEDVLIAISITACGASGIYYSRLVKKQEQDKQKANISEHIRDKVYNLWRIGLMGIASAVGILIYYQLNHQFNFNYVYQHTSLELPFIYRISALWAGKEGSFLLWALIAVAMGYLVLNISFKGVKGAFPIYVGITESLLIMSFVVRPFKVLDTVPTDGVGLSIALQDPWMVIHPPLVFVGYTAMAILFCIGLNIGNKQLKDINIEAFIKRWIRISLVFLGLGIMTGSVWAYRALGWGGYWAWDPIENIALVPWLLLCAYQHDYQFDLSGKKQVIVMRLKYSIPFGIAILGTFLVRSGLLAESSAHAYVGNNYIMDKTWVKIFILASLIVVIAIIAILIYKNTAHHIYEDKVSAKQGHSIRCIKNFKILTYIYAYTILCATLFPLFITTLFQEVNSYQVPKTFYNQLTLGYVIINALLLSIMELKGIWVRKILGIVGASVIFSLIIANCFEYNEISLIIVLAIILVPLIKYIIDFKKGYYQWSHILLLIMIVGGITSSGMGATYMTNFNQNNVENKYIEYIDRNNENIVENKSSIINKIAEDEVVETISYNEQEDSMLLMYTTKPLIILFWIGSFGLLGVIGIRLLEKHS